VSVKPVSVDDGRKAVMVESNIEQSTSVEREKLAAEDSEPAEEQPGQVEIEDELTDKEVSLPETISCCDLEQC